MKMVNKVCEKSLKVIFKLSSVLHFKVLVFLFVGSQIYKTYKILSCHTDLSHVPVV